MTYADTLRPLDDITLEARPAPEPVLLRAVRHGTAWWRRHRRSLVIVAGLLAVAATAHAWGMYRFPSRTVNDDEGTYVAQAWAVLRRGTLAHYTYWYDHPPLGWLQIAGWAWLTDGFDRVPEGVSVGREFMLVAKVASCGLLYLLGWRLGFRRPFAAAAVLLYALSPLALQFNRMVFLDNLTVPWLLAALVLALSPGKRLIAAAGSAATFAVAVLTKETALVLLPGVVWFLWRGSDPRTPSQRRPMLTARCLRRSTGWAPTCRGAAG